MWINFNCHLKPRNKRGPVVKDYLTTGQVN